MIESLDFPEVKFIPRRIVEPRQREPLEPEIVLPPEDLNDKPVETDEKPKKKYSRGVDCQRVKNAVTRVVELANAHAGEKCRLRNRHIVNALLRSAFNHQPQHRCADNAGINMTTLDKYLSAFREFRDHGTPCPPHLKTFGRFFYKFQGAIFDLAAEKVRELIEDKNAKVVMQIFQASNPEEFGSAGDRVSINNSKTINVQVNNAVQALSTKTPEEKFQLLNALAERCGYRLVKAETPLLEGPEA